MEPCPNLPKYHLVGRMTYCGHHMAWEGRVELIIEDGSDPRLAESRAVAFGPFDRREDVLSWLTDRLGSLEPPPGLPWW